MSETNAEEQATETSSSSSSAGTSVLLDKGRGGLLGIKAGMTQVYTEEGDAVAVTVISLRPNIITQVKTKEKEGYSALQVGFLEKTKEKKVNKSEKGRMKKVGKLGFGYYQEIRLPENAKMDGMEVGQEISPEFLKEGDYIDLTAFSKGKGFQGVMKRHHFGGGMGSHGASIVHRMPGAIGQNRQIGKVLKGKKMAGQMGNEQVTIQNVRVVRVDLENQVLLVHGSVPGPRSGVVTIRKAIKVG